MGDVRYLPGHEPKPLLLRFGLNDVWPEEGPGKPVAAYGCRLIVRQDGDVDFVPDRQDADGPDVPRKLLLELLMRRFAPSRMKEAVGWLLRYGHMSTRAEEWFVLHMDDELTVVANTNASAGYCYVTAWLVPGGGE